MKIGIDCRFSSTNSGLGRYTRELVTHLLKRDDDIEYVLFVHSEEESWLSHLLGSYLLVPSPYNHYSLFEQTRFPNIISSSNIDLLFSPHFNVPLRCPVPFIVTVHDLILHAFPNSAPLWKRLGYRLQMKHAVKNAKHIISVSNYTKNEIEKCYFPNTEPEYRTPIIAIPNGVQSSFCPKSTENQKRVLDKYGLHEPFFLYVGNFKEHKNVKVLKETAQNAHVQLVCASELTGSICDDELACLYSSAKAFVTASLSEGFCLPACEALACGCPVIASNRGAIPEVTQGHAKLIEPTVDAFIEAFKSPPSRRDPLRLYNWDDTAERTANVLVQNYQLSIINS
jgi:glycosyltransferase involved in cell wall biosynthesis